MSSRCRIRIPRETWGYLTILVVVLIGAIMREINLMIILAGLMLGPLLISLQLIRATLRNLELSRVVPASAFPDERLSVAIQVKNRRPRLDSWALVIEDRIQLVNVRRKQRPLTVRTLLPHVAAGDAEQVEYRCQLGQRGRYRLGPLRVRTRVPLGLLQGSMTIGQADELLVYPRLGQLSDRWSELVKVDRLGQHSSRRHQGPIEGDYYGLRDWRPGDSRRWIHWRSSAKRNSLVVRQFELHRSQDFVLLLDLWQGHAPTRDPQEQAEIVERAVSFAATAVADECRRAAGNVILGVAGESVQQVRGPAGVLVRNEALQLLAEAQESATDQLPELLRQVLPAATLDDRVVVVSLQPAGRHDSSRFEAGPYAARERQILEQAVTIDATASDFADMFSWEAAVA